MSAPSRSTTSTCSTACFSSPHSRTACMHAHTHTHTHTHTGTGRSLAGDSESVKCVSRPHPHQSAAATFNVRTHYLYKMFEEARIRTRAPPPRARQGPGRPSPPSRDVPCDACQSSRDGAASHRRDGRRCGRECRGQQGLKPRPETAPREPPPHRRDGKVRIRGRSGGLRPRVPRPARAEAKTASPPPTRLGLNCRRRTMKESLTRLGSLAPGLELSTRINARHAKRLRDETNCESVCIACVERLCSLRGSKMPTAAGALVLDAAAPSGHDKTCCGTTRDAIEPDNGVSKLVPAATGRAATSRDTSPRRYWPALEEPQLLMKSRNY